MDLFIEYCKNNPVLTVLMVGLLIFILALAILTFILKQKAEEANARQQLPLDENIETLSQNEQAEIQEEKEDSAM